MLITSKLPVLAKVFDLDYKKVQIRFLKDNIEEKTTTEAYFKYGMVLLGISVIYDDQQNKNEEDKYEGIEDRIADFSRAMAPMLIPMIKEFGELDLKNELIEQLVD